MELLYLWVDWYRNIRNQEFRFSSEFDIKFDKELKKLKINKKDNLHSFLFDDAFLNITAIIGKNGSGKSSLLSLIKSMFSDQFLHDNDYVMVIKEQNGNIIVIDDFCKGGNSIDFEVDNGIHYTIQREPQFITDSILLINFSNSFSVYESDYYLPKFIDISFDSSLSRHSEESNNLLLEKYESLLKEFENKEKDEQFERHKKAITKYTQPRAFMLHHDLLANVGFIMEYKDTGWSFVPEVLEIYFNYLFFKNHKEYFLNTGLSNKLDQIERIIFDRRIDFTHPTDINKVFKEQLTMLLFMLCVIDDRQYYPPDEELIKSIEIISGQESDEQILNAAKEYFTTSSPPSHRKELNAIKAFVLEIDSKFDSYKKNAFQADYPNSYRLYVNQQMKNTLEELFGFWKFYDFIFSFKWEGMSAGEAALLNIFSKIHYSARYSSRQKTIWLLLDEADLYLHPEWQRKFFADLHEYLPKFFKNKKIQLLLTSHSPFLVSDLPKDNILLLDKMGGLCKLVDKSEFDKTFGSNIHSLFKETFFLEGGTIGEFAKEKILTLLEFLKSKSKKSFKYELDDKSSQKIIDCIGEPILKELLQSMWDDKYLDDELAKKSKIQLQRKIKLLTLEIKRIKNETDNNNK